MTDEHADRYVSQALSSHEDWDTFELMAGRRSQLALIEAFARRGWSATPQARPGLLLVSRSDSIVTPGGRSDDGPELF